MGWYPSGPMCVCGVYAMVSSGPMCVCDGIPVCVCNGIQVALCVCDGCKCLCVHYCLHMIDLYFWFSLSVEHCLDGVHDSDVSSLFDITEFFVTPEFEVSFV